QRIATVESHGLTAVSTSTMARFFSEPFRQRRAATVASHQRLLEATDPEGYTACAAALCDADTAGRLNQIRVPCLVLSSTHDEPALIDMAQVLAKGIAGAQLITLRDCAHLSA